jgi:hypothetical protein
MIIIALEANHISEVEKKKQEKDPRYIQKNPETICILNDLHYHNLA